MKLKLYRSATIGIYSNGTKVLTDPWLTDGEYYGSWSHYPYFDLVKNLKEINSYNYIYISHIHPDHCSNSTLKLIDKNIPILIGKYNEKFLKIKLERMGFSVIELEHGKRKKINDNFYINIFSADNCDPKLCYKFSGCANLVSPNGSQNIDTLCVFDDGKRNILNLNDCPFDLAKSTFKKILKEYGKIDTILTGYSGAGPFPQCIDNYDFKQKLIQAEIKKNNFIKQAYKYISAFNPKYYLPFAGTYTLSGKLSYLNPYRGIPSIDYTYDKLNDLIKTNKKLNTKAIKINPGSEFDISLETSDKIYKPIDQKKYQNYINDYLSKKEFDYENAQECDFDEIYNLSTKAIEKYIEKKFIKNVMTKTNIIFNIGERLIKIDNEKNKIDTILFDQIKNEKDFVKFTLDINLFKNILKGPKYAHWNNAEIGSHIRYFRKPNLYERELYDSICYFHT